MCDFLPQEIKCGKQPTSFYRKIIHKNNEVYLSVSLSLSLNLSEIYTCKIMQFWDFDASLDDQRATGDPQIIFAVTDRIGN